MTSPCAHCRQALPAKLMVGNQVFCSVACAEKFSFEQANKRAAAKDVS